MSKVLVLFTAGVNVYKTEKAVFRSVMPTVEQGVYLTDSYQRLGYWLKDNTDPDQYQRPHQARFYGLGREQV